MKTPRIVVVGSSNTDMVVKGRRLPAPGETVIGGQFVLAAGGKGANQAVAAARLGAEVTLIAKVGCDMFGDQAIENFRKEGIDTARVLRDPQHATGVALILVDGQGENLISVASGRQSRPDARGRRAGGRADPHGRPGDAPIGDPRWRPSAAATIAAEADVPVILNPAPAAPCRPASWPSVTYLTPNETEAEDPDRRPSSDEASAREAAGETRWRRASGTSS